MDERKLTSEWVDLMLINHYIVSTMKSLSPPHVTLNQWLPHYKLCCRNSLKIKSVFNHVSWCFPFKLNFWAQILRAQFLSSNFELNFWAQLMSSNFELKFWAHILSSIFELKFSNFELKFWAQFLSSIFELNFWAQILS